MVVMRLERLPIHPKDPARVPWATSSTVPVGVLDTQHFSPDAAGSARHPGHTRVVPSQGQLSDTGGVPASVAN